MWGWILDMLIAMTAAFDAEASLGGRLSLDGDDLVWVSQFGEKRFGSYAELDAYLWGYAELETEETESTDYEHPMVPGFGDRG